MSAIRSKNTLPELLLRKALHALGLRYRLHVSYLPGKPDLVFRRFNAIVLVNGCFWHGHECKAFKWPEENGDWWRDKIDGNRARDGAIVGYYLSTGWRVSTVWECALKRSKTSDIKLLADHLAAWLKCSEPTLELSGQE